MGSNTGPGSGPFGYNIDMPDSAFDEAAAPPPPQRPLLSSNQENFLSEFLGKFTEDHFNSHTYDQYPSIEGLIFTDTWCPEVIAHGISFGHANASAPPLPDLGHNVLFGMSHYMPPAMPPVMLPAMPPSMNPSDLHPSADVLAAASALSRPSGAHQDMMFSQPPMLLSSSNMSPTSMSSTSMSSPPVSSSAAMSPMLDSAPDYAYGGYGMTAHNCIPRYGHGPEYALVNMLSPPQTMTPQPTRSRTGPCEIQWGSDSSFNQPCYQPSYKESLDAVHRQQAAVLSCLTRNESAAPTRVSSPVSQHTVLPPTEPATPSLKTRRESRQTQSKFTVEVGGPPRKRRKSSVREDSCQDDVNGSMPPSDTPPAVRGKAKQPAATQSKAAAQSQSRKRRKSGAKPTRENLTEDQRRENHILSEKKRRNMIKDGFAELKRLVPEIDAPALSKSTVLEKSCKWIEELKEGNDRLQSLLDNYERSPAAFGTIISQEADQSCLIELQVRS